MNLRDNQKRAKDTVLIFYVLLGFWCFDKVFQFGMFRSSDIRTDNGLFYLSDIFLIINFVYKAIYLLGIIFFIRWFHRAYYNLHQVNVPLNYNQGWAVGGWFVPLLNLFTPYLIMEEIWKYTQIKANHSPVESNLIIRLWWLTFISNFLATMGFIYFSYLFLNFDIVYFRIISIVISLFTLVAFLLIIRIVKKIAAWEKIIYHNGERLAIEDHLLSD